MIAALTPEGAAGILRRFVGRGAMRRVLVGLAVFLAIGVVVSVWEAGGPRAAIETLAVLTSSPPTEPQRRAHRRSGPEYFSNRTVYNQYGEALSFYDDVIKERIVVVSMIYTNCPDICPLTTARKAQVQERLGDRVGRDIFFVSITVDPENDTPEVLKDYAEAFGAGPGWVFLTGDPEDMRHIRARFGDRNDELHLHTQEVRLGNDRTGEWQRTGILNDIEIVLRQIRDMDPDFRATPQRVPFNPAANTGYEMADDPGQHLFRRLCSTCHTVGVGDRVGPDLYGITERRDPMWLMRYIMDPPQMRRDGDPIALALREQYPSALMPRLGVRDMDVYEILDYVERETGRIVEMRAQHPIQDHDHSDHDHGDHSHDHSSHHDSEEHRH
jgi:protein SCO1